VSTAVLARGLAKSYGDLEAVRGIDLEVARGELFAFLGPNGAGKTTTVEILEGFRRRSGGQVEVLGVDPQRFTRSDRARIGCVLQTGDAERRLTPREALGLWASYYPSPRSVDEVLELIGLTASADVLSERLSGGQRRRLEVGMALVGNPELMFLDEPTTGFDPEARRDAWELIAGLRDLGTTVFLTTHYMEEAQRLADRVAIIKGGAIVAEGPPDQLSAEREPVIVFALPSGVERGELPGAVAGLARGDGHQVRIPTRTPTAVMAELCGWASAAGLELDGLTVERATLEDVYLELAAQEPVGA